MKDIETCVGDCKTPEIIAQLRLLQEKIMQLREKISPVMMMSESIEEEAPIKNESEVMSLINITIRLIDDTKDSIDIN